ncbi:Retrotransposon protein [Gossypium australe]|uniref:Retrotransposon protein n=1 Tax=Gossypium australe TaxID=47621 RepID=A0A5B6VN04_9ROSI|nr:Retrotransposon protein [Gossypium australe]
MDFVSGLPLSPSKKNSVWVVVDRLINSTHFLHSKFSIAFHPQRNGQSERVIQVSENMMCFCMINFGINWERYVPLIALA